MKASELRIGNLVKIGGEINQLELCDFVDIHDHKTIWQYEPITITVEWLVKLGFGYHAFDKNYVIRTQKGWHNSIKEIDGDWCYNNNFSDANCYFVREVKYVHQLQNLYYALNEEEL